MKGGETGRIQVLVDDSSDIVLRCDLSVQVVTIGLYIRASAPDCGPQCSRLLIVDDGRYYCPSVGTSIGPLICYDAGGETVVPTYRVGEHVEIRPAINFLGISDAGVTGSWTGCDSVSGLLCTVVVSPGRDVLFDWATP